MGGWGVEGLGKCGRIVEVEEERVGSVHVRLTIGGDSWVWDQSLPLLSGLFSAVPIHAAGALNV